MHLNPSQLEPDGDVRATLRATVRWLRAPQSHCRQTAPRTEPNETPERKGHQWRGISHYDLPKKMVDNFINIAAFYLFHHILAICDVMSLSSIAALPPFFLLIFELRFLAAFPSPS
jgi:hypothetical protein